MQMTQASTPTQTNATRRRVLLGGAAALSLAPLVPAFALDTNQAKSLVERMVEDINEIINSGMSEARMLAAFETDIFAKYADVNIIALSALGPPARTASNADKRRFTAAFRGYMARKYGRRFREFVGGEIIVERAEPWKSHFQVHTTTKLRGTAPFNVIYRVSDRSGQDKFFDMLIEGISLLKTEAVEIRAIYDANGRSVTALTNALKALG